MRFKKGNKVEVLSKVEVPCGSWLCAEIICGNGHHYTVKYDGYQDDAGEAVVERVFGKDIRPCPPALELMENWNPGDVVEVFQNFSWKMATVLKVLEKNYILVRLLGSSLEFQVSKFDIRVRQSWQDDKWIIVGKGSASCENRKRSGAQLQKTATKTKLSGSTYYHPEKKKLSILESQFVSFKTLKRGSHSQLEAYAEPPPRFRALEKEGRCHRARVRNPPTPFEQLKGISFPRDVVAEECLPASVNNRKTGISNMVDVERRKQTGTVLLKMQTVSLVMPSLSARGVMRKKRIVRLLHKRNWQQKFIGLRRRHIGVAYRCLQTFSCFSQGMAFLVWLLISQHSSISGHL